MGSLRRSALPHRYAVPSREDVAARLEALLADHSAAARENAAAWAVEYILFDDPQLYPEVRDAAVWNALTQLAGVDLRDAPDLFLHETEDVAVWLDELRGAGS